MTGLTRFTGCCPQYNPVNLVNPVKKISLPCLDSVNQLDKLVQYAGAFLVAFPIVLFSLLVFINKKSRTSANLLPWTITIGVGLLLSVIGVREGGFLGISLAAGATSLWGLYLVWYSKFNDRATNQILKVGETLPNFQLEDGQTKMVSSDIFIGNPSIYLFYRGN